MLGSVAEGASGSGTLDILFGWVDRLPALLMGAGLVAAALAAYWLPGSDRFYNHFVWQALAFLHGTAVIDYPVNAGGFPKGNDWMQDIYPLSQLTGDPSTTGALLPFPPLPAIVLVPFVAIWGIGTDIRAVSALTGAVDVGIAWWALGRLAVSRRIRVATTIFFAFGTVLWYAAQLGTTWFFAHVVAVGFILAAVGVALGSDAEADDDVGALPAAGGLLRSLVEQLRRPLALFDRRQVLAGLLFGLACTARLPVLFGAPFFMLVGGGGTWVRRSVSAGLGTALPVGLLLLYNVATTGHVFHPGYDWQYQREASGYPTLNYNPDWGIEDPRYLVQNLGIMLLSTPVISPDLAPGTLGDGAPVCTDPGATRGLFDRTCPLAEPRATGMSILLTSPAFLLGLFAFRSRRSRLLVGSSVAIVAIASINLMHFSQGWVQFGYRFSNDFIAFALPLVAIGMARRGGVRWLGVGLIAASVAINLWGVIWGNILGMVIARRLALVAPFAVAVVVVANAWSGLMPGVGFWDTGEFQTVLPIMGTAHPTGYPTYVLLGFLANILLTPIGEPAFRVTVLSLLAVATAAGATVVLVRRLTGSTIIGIATGLGLATTPVVWLNATRADPHPIHLAFVALLLVVLVWWEHGRRDLRARETAAAPDATAPDATPPAAPAQVSVTRPTPAERRGVDRRLILAAVLFGLAAGNHSLTLLLVPPVGLYVLAVEPGIWRRFRFVLTCLGAVVATVVLVYLELPIRGGLVPASLIYGRPATWDGFWYIALAEQFRGSLSDPLGDLAAKLDHVVALARNQLGLLALAIPPAFVVAAWRAPRFTLLTGLALVITVLFNQAYANADIERYYLGPVLWVWLWIGILAAELVDAGVFVVVTLAARLSRPAPPDGDPPRLRWAAGLAAVVVAVVLLLPTLGDLDARRHDADRSKDTGAQAWLAQALPAVAQGAVLVSWWSTSTPLWYAQKVEGLRPDIDVVDDRTMLDLNLGRAPDVINRYLGTRPVYVIRLEGRDTDELTSQFDMTVVASGGSTAVWVVNGRLAAAR